MIDQFTQQALNWAFREYNKRRRWRDSAVEFGCLLWKRKTPKEKLEPGILVHSADSSYVNLYPRQQLPELLEMFDEKIVAQRDYWGDFHTHVAQANSLLAHFPSPADITCHSALCDLWDLGPENDHACLPFSPKVQLIQTLLFGDVFVLLPALGQPAFTSLPAQDAVMIEINAAYAHWHESANATFGDRTNITHEDFIKLAHQELPHINTLFQGRGVLSFHANPVAPP